MDAPPAYGAAIASVAALIGDPARAAILTALVDGRSRPAGELARLAGVHPATATAHLRRLVVAGLLTVHPQGRHRYHRLAGPRVATALEALGHLAPAVPARSLRQHQAANALAEARLCYDHLAGNLGVQLRDQLLHVGALRTDGEGDHMLTERGATMLAELGIDIASLRSSRRVFARSCLDWTERRYHLAGALPAALTARFITAGWLTRRDGDRALRVSPTGRHALPTWTQPKPDNETQHVGRTVSPGSPRCAAPLHGA